MNTLKVGGEAVTRIYPHLRNQNRLKLECNAELYIITLHSTEEKLRQGWSPFSKLWSLKSRFMCKTYNGKFKN